MSSTATTCCICLTEYGVDESPFALSCGHHVHSDCMLRMCLNGPTPARCPYCRASLGSAATDLDNLDDLDDFEESEESSEEEETEVAAGPQIPQWMRVQWVSPMPGRPTSLRLQRIQQDVVKKLLSRANNRGAPDILKRCSEGLKRLKADLAAARADAKVCKSGRSRKTVKETLRLLKRKDALVQKLERRVLAHMRNTLVKCQKSQNVVNYFWLHPIADVR